MIPYDLYADYPRSVMVLGDNIEPEHFGQHMVPDQQTFQSIVEKYNGKANIYTSHSSYPGSKDKRVDQTETVSISKLFIDLDHKTKVENSHEDAQTYRDWTRSEQLSQRIAFSGKKGFQCLLEMGPSGSRINSDLTDAYRTIVEFFRTEVELRTIDTSCAEPRRVMRVINTSHYHQKKRGSEWESTGTVCFPLSEKDLERDTDEIIQMAGEMGKIQPWSEGTTVPSFSDFIERFDIKPEEYRTRRLENPSAFTVDYPETKSDQLTMLKMLYPDPCVHLPLHHRRNPPHFVRFAACVQDRLLHDMTPRIEWEGKTVHLAPSPKSVDEFYENQKYTDYKNRPVRRAQINHIFGKRVAYQYPTCSKLFDANLCVGDRCPKFKRFLNPESDQLDRERLAQGGR